MLDQKLKALLKQNGFSLTSQRLRVFEVLASKESLSMRQLVDACLPRANRATTYRIVELFESLGVTKRIQLGWKYRLELSDLFREHHHHIECLDCGRVVELKEDKSFEAMISDVALRVDFRSLEHSLEIRGLCLVCQKNRGPENIGATRKPHTSATS